MATPIYFNPYWALGFQHNQGLASVIQCIQSGSSSSSSGMAPVGPSPITPAVEVPTIQRLIECTLAYIQPIYGSELGVTGMLELSIIAGDAVNGYINVKQGGYLNYNPKQQEFIFQLLEGINGIPLDTIPDYITNVEENIASSGMSAAEQAPLLLAGAIGRADYVYWAGESGGGSAATKAASPWKGYLDKLGGETSYIPSYVQAAMEGSLIGSKRSLRSSVLNTSGTIGLDAVAALTSSIITAAGVVIFRWLPRVAEVN